MSAINDLNYTRSNCKLMSEDVRELGKAFLLASAKFAPLQKSGLNKHQGNRYSTLEDIYNSVVAALRENNIWITHTAFVTEDCAKEILYTRLTHVPTGQWIHDERLLESEKPGHQGKGTASTYSKRYALLNLCGIPGDMDDDGVEEQIYIEKKEKKTKVVITAAQRNNLKEQIDSSEYDPDDLIKTIKKQYKVKDLDDLTEEQYFLILKNVFKK